MAEPRDAELITALINQAFRSSERFFIDEDRIDLEGVLNLLKTGEFLLAESERVIVGCIYVEFPHETENYEENRAYLGLLAVDPARHRSGIASTLMNTAEDHCREQGANFMDLKVVSLRGELFSFYQKRGYIETGTLPFPPEVETKLPCHLVKMSKPLNPTQSSGRI